MVRRSRARTRVLIALGATIALLLALTRAHGGSDRGPVVALDADAQEHGRHGGDPQSLPGAREVQALRAGYPSRISAAEVRDGEWALEMDGIWYYWAEGRLLPEGLRDRSDEFMPVHLYRYELGPMPEREITPDLRRVLSERSTQQADERQRFNEFFDSLYQISSRDEAERMVRRVSFLGFNTRVHPLAVEPLAQVERTILAIMPHDESVARFVRDLGAVHGFTWRNIAGTVRRSYHSYGVAVDLLPRSYRGTFPYWLWAAQAGIEEWWDPGTAARWDVPQPIVDAFEDRGFIWGGKWLFFDNLHFEYRPESILMAEQRSTL